MAIPIRILRADIEDLRGARPPLSFRDMDRRDLILEAARRLLASHGRDAITIAGLAGALFLCAGAVRRSFPDMDNLIGEILRIHLRKVSNALAAVPFSGADRRPALRAAYLAATRTNLGSPTEAHLLMLTMRQQLPPDERHSVDNLRASIGDILAGDHGQIALNLLDMPELDAAAVERMLAVAAQPSVVATDAVATKPALAPEPPAELVAAPGAPAVTAPPAIEAPLWAGREMASPMPPPRPPRHKKSVPDATPPWPGPSLYANAIKDLARWRGDPGNRPP